MFLREIFNDTVIIFLPTHDHACMHVQCSLLSRMNRRLYHFCDGSPIIHNIHFSVDVCSSPTYDNPLEYIVPFLFRTGCNGLNHG